jgi:GNAT superfamily N-acetyltransferase
MALIIRALALTDDRSTFRSGNIDLDRFFQRFAAQNQFRHYIGVTYVAVDGAKVLGFVTVTAASLETSTLSPAARKKLPAFPLSVLRLARPAVAASVKGQGAGSSLLRFVFALAHEMSALLGCVGVVVDANLEAVASYERCGFVALEAEAGHLGDRPEPSPMFLEIGAIPKPRAAR